MMKSVAGPILLTALMGVAASATARLSPEQRAQLPSPAGQPVAFGTDIQPLLEASCLHCHGRGKAKGGFSLETRETLLRGGDSGPAIVVGRSAESYLIELVSGLDPDNVMPLKGNKLSAAQVGVLRTWIDQGAAWDATVSFAKQPPANLIPRQPELPSARKGLTHPVDRWLQPYFDNHQIQRAAAVDDRSYARRVFLDVIGLLPSPEELEAFVAERPPGKRARLVDRLLADHRRYAEHWLSFWNDALRNDYRGTGYIDGGRKQISAWLFGALAENRPYDRLVAELVNPTPASEGFVKGIVWRGAVNSSQTPEMQAAQNIAQLFMGVNLKCASCHDSFINDWTLKDAYGMAAVYADGPLEMFRCDKPTGEQAAARFLYPQLGEIPLGAPKATKQARLAEILTARENGRLSRTIVNRLWQKFLGVGLVEPVDDMEQPAWHPDLLDWLAEDLVAHGYDLKHTMKTILTSRAYQLPAVSVDEQTHGGYVFAGPAVRRMSAEQFRDALGTLTGVWYERPALKLEAGALPAATEETAAVMPAKARWIWSDPEAAARALPETVYFWKSFTLDAVPAEALAVAACDNSYTLYVNATKVMAGKEWNEPNFADLRPHLKPGLNVIAVAAVNHRPNNQPPVAEAPPRNDEANPAGLLVYARLRGGGRTLDLATDATWVWSKRKRDHWQKPDGVAPDAAAAIELGGPELAPWKLGPQLASALSLALWHGETRSSLVAADPLTTALGRPPREQMMTRRQTAATTLQALELTNGQTLSRVLQEGAQKLLAVPPASTDELVRDLYRKGLGRPPAATELALARDLLGQPLSAQPVEDFLWSLVMLPDFQLIY